MGRRKQPQIMQQYGVRWIPHGPVSAYSSRGKAEAALLEDGRGIGVLVVSEGVPGRPESEWTPWAEVTARFPECTCWAPDDAEPEDHDTDCPENPGWDEEDGT